MFKLDFGPDSLGRALTVESRWVDSRDGGLKDCNLGELVESIPGQMLF